MRCGSWRSGIQALFESAGARSYGMATVLTPPRSKTRATGQSCRSGHAPSVNPWGKPGRWAGSRHAERLETGGLRLLRHHVVAPTGDGPWATALLGAAELERPTVPRQ